MKTRNHRTTHRKIDRRKLAALRTQAQTFLYGLKPFAECVEVLNNVFAQVPHDPETTKALCLIKAALLYAATHQPKDFPALVEMVQRNHEIFHSISSTHALARIAGEDANSVQARTHGGAVP